MRPKNPGARDFAIKRHLGMILPQIAGLIGMAIRAVERDLSEAA
jgi:hypothetical protein